MYMIKQMDNKEKLQFQTPPWDYLNFPDYLPGEYGRATGPLTSYIYRRWRRKQKEQFTLESLLRSNKQPR